MARSFNGSTYIDFTTAPAGCIMMEQTSGAISGWFKSTDAGTSRIVIYNEGASGGGGNVNFFVCLNDGTAGQIRIFRRNVTPTQVSMTYDGGYNDGEWHLFTYSWSSLSNHTLYVDGVSRDTDTTDLSGGALTGVDLLSIGRRRWAASTASNFIGDIADIVIHDTELSLAEHTELYNKSKHAMNVHADTDVRAYYPLHISEDERDIADIAKNNTSSWTSTSSTNSNGPDGAGPTGMTSNTDFSKAWVFSQTDGSAVITAGGTDSVLDDILREPGNVVYDPTDKQYPYKLFYGMSASPYTGSNGEIFLATARNISGPWTKQGAVIENSTLPVEDPYVYRDPVSKVYNLYGENKTGGVNNGICHFTSTDGFSWTRVDSNGSPTLPKGGASAFDESAASSPIVWKEDDTWYMIYEGLNTSNVAEIGLATSSDGASWTKDGSNPVFTTGENGSYGSQRIDPHDIIKIDGVYWLSYSASPDGTNYRNAIASSSNLTSWTPFTYNAVSTTTLGLGIYRLGGTEFGKGYVNSNDGTELVEVTLYGDGTSLTQVWPFSGSAITGNRDKGLSNKKMGLNQNTVRKILAMRNNTGIGDHYNFGLNLEK